MHPLNSSTYLEIEVKYEATCSLSYFRKFVDEHFALVG